MKKGFIKVLLLAVIVFIAFMCLNKWAACFVLAAVILYTIYSNLPDIYTSLGKLTYGKDNDKMFRYFERAYKTGKMKPQGRVYYAYMCLREGRLESAERLLNSVLAYKQKPEIMANARLNYALLLWKKGELDEAIELTSEVYETYKNSVVYGNYGYLLILKGDLQKALKINLEGYEYNDTNPVICDNLGQNYYLLGEYEKSREIYDKFLEDNPAFPIPYYNYAKTLYALGEKSAAIDNLKTALDLPFSGIAELKKEDVENLLAKIESELS